MKIRENNVENQSEKWNAWDFEKMKLNEMNWALSLAELIWASLLSINWINFTFSFFHFSFSQILSRAAANFSLTDQFDLMRSIDRSLSFPFSFIFFLPNFFFLNLFSSSFLIQFSWIFLFILHFLFLSNSFEIFNLFPPLVGRSLIFLIFLSFKCLSHLTFPAFRSPVRSDLSLFSLSRNHFVLRATPVILTRFE